MAEERIKRIADGIYKEVGGQENVDKVIHCMTRVRMDIRDYDKVDIEGLKKIDGVMGVVEDDTLQVVVGPGTVNKVAQEMVDQAGVKLGKNHLIMTPQLMLQRQIWKRFSRRKSRSNESTTKSETK